MSASSIHSRLRALEGDADRLLSQYSGLIASPGTASSAPDDLATNLATRTADIDELERLAAAPGAAPATAHQAQRHREILDEHRATSRRLADALAQERNRHNLLHNVRADIAAHRARTAQGSADDYFLDERGRVENSNAMADRLLAEAYETRADFAHQQQTLANVQRRIWSVFSRVPGINAVISKINSRQKRNSLVLAGVIVLGIIFLFFFH